MAKVFSGRHARGALEPVLAPFTVPVFPILSAVPASRRNSVSLAVNGAWQAGNGAEGGYPKEVSRDGVISACIENGGGLFLSAFLVVFSIAIGGISVFKRVWVGP